MGSNISIGQAAETRETDGPIYVYLLNLRKSVRSGQECWFGEVQNLVSKIKVLTSVDYERNNGQEIICSFALPARSLQIKHNK